MPETNEELGTNLFPEPETPASAKKKASKRVPDEDRTWIVLEENPDVPPTGLGLSVNGDVCLILPGEPVHLPNKYVEVLDHAIITVPVLNSSQQITGHRERHRFPYRKVDAPAGS